MRSGDDGSIDCDDLGDLKLSSKREVVATSVWDLIEEIAYQSMMQAFTGDVRRTRIDSFEAVLGRLKYTATQRMTAHFLWVLRDYLRNLEPEIKPLLQWTDDDLLRVAKGGKPPTRAEHHQP